MRDCRPGLLTNLRARQRLVHKRGLGLGQQQLARYPEPHQLADELRRWDGRASGGHILPGFQTGSPPKLKSAEYNTALYVYSNNVQILGSNQRWSPTIGT